MEQEQQTANGLLGTQLLPLSNLSYHSRMLSEFTSTKDVMPERADANIASLLRRFENIIAYTPVRIVLFCISALFVFSLMRTNFYWGAGWGCLVWGVLSPVLKL